MYRTLEAGAWRDQVELRANPVLEPQAYYDFLAPECESLDIWETEYLHVLSGDQPVLASGEADPRLKDTPATDKRIQCSTCPFELDKETGLVTIKPGSGVVAGGVRH